MSSMKNPAGTIAARWWWVFPVLVLGIFVGDRILNGKNGAAHFGQMQQEFRTIPTPPSSDLTEKLDHFSMWNSHKASVGAAYATRLRESEIRDFYDRELMFLGWQPKKTDSSEKSYCKGDLSASIRFGDYVPTGASYVLSLDWGAARNRACR
jgi:hypothetical protein